MVGRRAGTHSWVPVTVETMLYPALASLGPQSQVDFPELGCLEAPAYYRLPGYWACVHTAHRLRIGSLVASWAYNLMGGIRLGVAWLLNQSRCVACVSADLLGEWWEAEPCLLWYTRVS